ncbi:MAG: hypothetical protein GMKNLPBB_01063 [Myxococcota bacterium]|nr:hypothetical protein [Myxococcota bacterium]
MASDTGLYTVLWECAADGSSFRLIAASAVLKQLPGFLTAAKTIGELHDALPPHERALALDALAQLRGGAGTVCLQIHPGEGGERLTLDVQARLMRSPDGAVTGYSGCGVIRPGGARVHEPPARTAAVVPATGTPWSNADTAACGDLIARLLGEQGAYIWSYDFASGVLDIAPHNSIVAGYSLKTQATQDRQWWSSKIHPDDLEEHYRLLSHYIYEPGAVFQQIFRISGADGGWRWIHSRGRIIERDAQGEPVRSVGIGLECPPTGAFANQGAGIRSMVDLALDGENNYLWISDMRGETLSFEPRNAPILGYSPEEHPIWQQWFWNARIHPEDLMLLPGIFANAEDGEWTEFGHRVMDIHGVWRMITVRIRVLERDEQGAPVRAVGICRDDTARWQAEEALKTAESVQRLALKASNYFVWVYNVPADEMRIVPDDLGVGGYTPRLDGMRTFHWWLDRIHPDDSGRFVTIFQDVVSGRLREFKYEVRLRSKTGGWIWLQAAGEVLERDKHGLPITVIGGGGDITAIKQMQMQLADSELRYRNILENVSAGVVVVDSHMRIVEANPWFTKTAGWTVQELLGRRVTDFIAPEERGEAMERIQVLLRGDRGFRGVRRRQIRKDGSIITTRVTTTPLRLPNGENGYVALIDDLPEEKNQELEEELGRIRKALEAVARDRDRLGRLMHDFANLMTPVTMNSELLAGHSVVAQSELKPIADDLARAAARACDLIQQYLGEKDRETGA